MTTTTRFTTIFTFIMCKKNTLLFVILVDVIHNIGIIGSGIKINCILKLITVVILLLLILCHIFFFIGCPSSILIEPPATPTLATTTTTTMTTITTMMTTKAPLTQLPSMRQMLASLSLIRWSWKEGRGSQPRGNQHT